MEIIKDFFDDPKLIRLDLLAFLYDFKKIPWLALIKFYSTFLDLNLKSNHGILDIF